MKSIVNAFVLFLLALIACSQYIPTRQFYLLDYPIRNDSIRQAIDSLGQLPICNSNVLIGSFDMPRIYDRNNITVRYTIHELNYFRYHLWALRPGDNIRDLVYRHLAAYRLFRELSSEYTGQPYDMQIKANILCMERYEHKSAEVEHFAAHLEMELELVHNDSLTPIVYHYFDRSEKIYQSELYAYVAKTSEILRQEIDQFITKIIQRYHPTDSLHE